MHRRPARAAGSAGVRRRRRRHIALARILLGWELGAGRGHAVKLTAIAGEMRARGHDVALACQQIAAAPADADLWQAPVWPGQLTTLARKSPVAPATMGDILAVLGLGDADAVAALVRGWDAIIAAVRPDAIAAEFAPALAMAAYGRVPSIALGNGFTLPPAHLPRFPSLTGRPAVHDEAMLIERVNRALARTGREVIEALPAIFRADHELASVLQELDPYRPWRTSALGSPTGATQAPIGGGGDEIFVYSSAREGHPNAFWQALAGSGLKVRVHCPTLSRKDLGTLADAGLHVESDPVPFARIAERSRLLVSHGGLGFVTAGLLAGIPQLIAPTDIEKQMIAASVEELGLGSTIHPAKADADALANQLRAAFADGEQAARCAAAAEALRARVRSAMEVQVADAVEALIS